MVRKNKLKFLHLVRGCIRVLCHTLINAEQVKCTLYTNYIYYAKPYSAIKTTMKNRYQNTNLMLVVNQISHSEESVCID